MVLARSPMSSGTKRPASAMICIASDSEQSPRFSARAWARAGTTLRGNDVYLSQPSW
jgi:hypothetical protein